MEEGRHDAPRLTGRRSEQAVHTVHVPARNVKRRVMLADRLLIGALQKAIDLAVGVVVQPLGGVEAFRHLYASAASARICHAVGPVVVGAGAGRSALRQRHPKPDCRISPMLDGLSCYMTGRTATAAYLSLMPLIVRHPG